MTSIYDISVYEGLSRVIQRLIPQQPALERLLNGFALVSKSVSKSFTYKRLPDGTVVFHLVVSGIVIVTRLLVNCEF